MEIEIPLSGGRITKGVVRKGNYVYRQQCANSAFVHAVLLWLENKDIACCPRYVGIDDLNREVLTYLEGTVPLDLGGMTIDQCVTSARIIRQLHDALRDFPGCEPSQTVCHNDLSPCNFSFMDGMPYAVFDWDAAGIGDPLDDLAYAAWMWLDIGNDEIPIEYTISGLKKMLDSYGAAPGDRIGFYDRVIAQMRRVGNGTFPTAEQALAVKEWTGKCENYISSFGNKYFTNI